MASKRTYIIKSDSTLHNQHLKIELDSTVVYLADTRKISSEDYVIELTDQRRSCVVVTAEFSLSGESSFISLGETGGKAGPRLSVRRIPPDASLEFTLNNDNYAWSCTSNVMGVRNWDFIRADKPDKPLASFSKTRGLLVRRKMGEMEIHADLDPELECVGLVCILANQERIRLTTQPSPGGGAGGFGGG